MASIRQLHSLEPQLLPWGQVELMVVMAGVGVSSVGVGLLISALVSDPAKALTVLPLAVIPLLLFSGLVVATWGRPAIEEVTYMNPVQWGGSAAAVTMNLQGSTVCGELTDADRITVDEALVGQIDTDQIATNQIDTNQASLFNLETGNPRWSRGANTQAVNLAALGGWSLALVPLVGVATSWSFRRPSRRG